MDMSSKTRIVVLHLKELIYTGIFALLGILFLLLLIIMFLPGKSRTPEGMEENSRFIPGKYTTSVILGNSSVDVEVVVDADNINSIRLVNLLASKGKFGAFAYYCWAAGFFPPMIRLSFFERISARPVVAIALAKVPNRM